MSRLGPTEPEWGELWQSFHRAVEASDPAERQKVLDGLEPPVRQEVIELLAAHNARSDLLATPLIGEPATDPLLGREIGPYRILRRLGKGGMGAVYLAEQEKPVRRRVALKVVRDPRLTEDILRRFQAERQVLVMMSHPHVATAFEAGDERDGDQEWPWISMEWVAGLPIDEFCDRYRLSPESRLKLFEQVLQGVAHAHRRGIVHRDLKETNVMVTVRDGEMVAKVIDFGIAKSLGSPLVERPAETHLGSPIGTPSAMSPEQASGHGGLEASSDVYSLGLLAHRLFAGVGPAAPVAGAAAQPPSESLAALPPSERYRLAERRGTSPSGLERWLKRIDAVLMRSLALDPTLRFQNATDFAEAILGLEASAGDRQPARRWLIVAAVLMALSAAFWGLSARFPALSATVGEPKEPSVEGLPQDPTEATVAAAMDDAGRASGTRPESSAETIDSRVPVAITFDDLPSSAPLTLTEEHRMTSQLLATLAERGVPATGFVNSEKVDEDPAERDARIDFLRRWLAEGHDLGNHGAHHLSLHHETVADYVRDIEACEPVLRQVLEERGQILRWFRHPYLRMGLDHETKNAVDGWLAEHGYTVGAVTLENVDWMFASAYRLRLQQVDRAGAEKVAREYLAFSERLFGFWEEVSDQLIGEPHPHVLLLHANQLNADYLDELLDMLDKKGYRFAPLEQVLAHPVYDRPATYAGPGGVLWQFRWAHAEGRKFDWRKEPVPPEWIVEISEQGAE